MAHDDTNNTGASAPDGGAAPTPASPSDLDAQTPSPSDLDAQPASPEVGFAPSAAGYAAAPLTPAYGAAPVGYPGPPGSVADTSRNWMGIVALVFGIIGGVLLALIFGILSYKAVREGKANNKAFATWGLALASVWALFGILAVVGAFALGNFGSENSAADAQPGDCYVSTLDTSEELQYLDPEYGDCTAETNAIVFDIATYTGSSEPTDPGFMDELWELCTADAAISDIDGDLAAEYYVEYYVPYVDSWDTDPHTIICSLSTETGAIDPAVYTGS